MAKPLLKKKQDLEKCKLPELKEIAKERGLKTSGKKDEIKKRIEENIKQHTSACKIQSVFRGKLLRKWIQLKKTANDVAVNETDFYTLELLSEMEFIYYIDYVDEKNNMRYVFNINSLICMLAKTQTLVNPYTREKLDKRLFQRLMEIVLYTYILFPESDLMSFETLLKTINPPRDKPRMPALPIDNNINYVTLTNELFMKIDELGNYTNVEWFNRMNNSQLSQFVFRMYKLWNKVDRDLRNRICKTKNLFSPDNLGTDRLQTMRTIEENRAMVIRIGETLVCDGIDIEHKKIGAMYFLMMLSVFSIEARQQMPWLFENYLVIMNQ